MRIKFFCIIIVTCDSCMLFDLSGQSGPCTPTLNTGNISNLFFFLSLVLRQIELTRVQTGPVRFEKTLEFRSKQNYWLINDNFVLGNVKEQSEKLVLHTTENC
jgi:hypothetical protein